ncbi:MAG: hypothetical protein ACJASP_002373, partial [Roseivirga sp.]
MINRRKFVKNASLITGISAGTGLSFLNFLFKQDGFQMTPLRNNVGVFTERGGTMGWMASKEGIVVVDTQFKDQAEHAIAEIKKIFDR